MTKEKPKNVAASVRQRLQNIARQRKEDFQLVLSRYALERLLHRISQSPHRDRFVVKGAMLFHLWTDQIYRPTRDIDFLAYGDHSLQHLESVFRDVCNQAVEDDGLAFQSESVTGSIIKPDQEYQGVRIHLDVKLERARIPVQIDIGFGDAITPGPQQVEYPSMLGFPTPIVSTYPRETVVAEKFQAMVMLGMANSRIKEKSHVRCRRDAAGESAKARYSERFDDDRGRRRVPVHPDRKFRAPSSRTSQLQKAFMATR